MCWYSGVQLLLNLIFRNCKRAVWFYHSSKSQGKHGFCCIHVLKAFFLSTSSGVSGDWMNPIERAESPEGTLCFAPRYLVSTAWSHMLPATLAELSVVSVALFSTCLQLEWYWASCYGISGRKMTPWSAKICLEITAHLLVLWFFFYQESKGSSIFTDTSFRGELKKSTCSRRMRD